MEWKNVIYKNDKTSKRQPPTQKMSNKRRSICAKALWNPFFKQLQLLFFQAFRIALYYDRVLINKCFRTIQTEVTRLIRNFKLYYVCYALLSLYLLQIFFDWNLKMPKEAKFVFGLIIAWSFINLFLYFFYKEKRNLEEHLYTQGFYLIIALTLLALGIVFEEVFLFLLPAVYLIILLVIIMRPFQKIKQLFVTSGTTSLVMSILFEEIGHLPHFYDDKAEILEIFVFYIIWTGIHLLVMILIKASKQDLLYSAIILGLALFMTAIPYILPIDFTPFFKYFSLYPVLFIPFLQWFFEKTLNGQLLESNSFLRKTILIPVFLVPLGIVVYIFFLIILFSNGFIPGP